MSDEHGSFTNWLERMKEEDRQLYKETWEEVANRVARAVLPLAAARGLKKQQALDFVEDVVTKVVMVVAKFDRSRGRARGWVRVIATRMLVDRVRRFDRQVVLSEEEQMLFLESAIAPDPLANRIDAEEQERRLKRVEKVIANLQDTQPRKMEVFDLCVCQGFSAEETAKQLGVTVGTVYNRKSEALQLLRDALLQIDTDEEQVHPVDRTP